MTTNELVTKNKDMLFKSLEYLDYSYKKVVKLKFDTTDFEELETWECFMARFARSIDIFISKYLRSRVLFEEPGYRGSLRDFLNTAEKLGFIEDSLHWIELKEIRNMQAHEYTETKLAKFFKLALEKAPSVLKLKDSL